MNNGVSIYQQIKEKDPLILNYLNIADVSQAKDTIKDYLDTYINYGKRNKN